MYRLKVRAITESNEVLDFCQDHGNSYVSFQNAEGVDDWFKLLGCSQLAIGYDIRGEFRKPVGRRFWSSETYSFQTSSPIKELVVSFSTQENS